DGVAVFGVHQPGRGVLVVGGGGDAGAEVDVPAQVEAVGDVPRVAEDLRLGRVALLPLVLLLQFRGEGVRVGEALHVHAGAGVAVPVPGAAHVGAGLEHDGRQVH